MLSKLGTSIRNILQPVEKDIMVCEPLVTTMTNQSISLHRVVKETRHHSMEQVIGKGIAAVM